METGDVEVQQHLWPHSEFKANLCCVRTCFPNKNKQQKINKTISYTLLEEKCFPSLSSGSASLCLWESPPPWSLSTQFNVSEKLSFLCHEKKHLALLFLGPLVKAVHYNCEVTLGKLTHDCLDSIHPFAYLELGVCPSICSISYRPHNSEALTSFSFSE